MKLLIQSLRIYVVLSLLTGFAYTAVVTGIGQALFPREAMGSLLKKGDLVVGSDLLAQKFQSDRYFWPRPSAVDYSTVPSGASNLGPTSEALKKLVDERAQVLRNAYALSPDAQLPPELLLASGSGLDPDVSPAAVELQVKRVAAARGYGASQTQKLRTLIAQQEQGGILGKPRVNILVLNMALDELK